MYSCAYFPSADASLEDAQLAKLDRICERLRLGPENHLLEIGTGWGGMAIHAARPSGCRVTTTTISRAQFELATERVREAGLEDQVTVLLEDYRDLDGRYDRLVSVEMIEAVGWQYFDDFFRRCDELLTDDGLMLLQAITIDDRIYEVEKAARSFANTHVFPGGCLPSRRLIATAWIARVTTMREVWIDDITDHYPPTLAAWRERFFDAWERLRGARLRRALPPPLGLLPELLGGGLPRAADRRRPGALREARMALDPFDESVTAPGGDPRSKSTPPPRPPSTGRSRDAGGVGRCC